MPLVPLTRLAVLVSEPVSWVVDFRCFCLDGRIKALSPYLRDGALASEENFAAEDHELSEAADFAEKVLMATADFTSRAVVIDVGLVDGFGWAVVEVNAAWGSGVYGCDPEIVSDVVWHATTVPTK